MVFDAGEGKGLCEYCKIVFKIRVTKVNSFNDNFIYLEDENLSEK